MKTDCRNCKVEKTLENTYFNVTKGYFSTYCRVCEAERSRQRYASDPVKRQKQIEYSAAYQSKMYHGNEEFKKRHRALTRKNWKEYYDNMTQEEYDAHKAYHNEYQKFRRATDENYRKQYNARARTSYHRCKARREGVEPKE